jgi:hypothetical protein
MTTTTKVENVFVAAALCLWIVAVGLGLRTLFVYAGTSGASGNPPPKWPVTTVIDAPRDQPVLVMIAHPQCPCTRASLSELAKIMSGRQSKVRAYVLFLKPRDFPEAWTESDLWSIAGGIPGVTVLRDFEGGEASKFKVSTSGHTLLYDGGGNLVFSGGITAARGHAGDNQSADLIAYEIDHGYSGSRSTPVFGCPVTATSPSAPPDKP